MTNEIVQKIEGIANASTTLTEAEVQHLFTLARKLIERPPNTERADFHLLKFYCDWTLHSRIDRSEAGAQVLQRVHDIVAEHLKKPDNRTLVADLTDALSLQTARTQLNTLIVRLGGPGTVFDDARWRLVVPLLVEIISNCPLTIANHSRFQKIIDAIRARPLKGTSVVEQLALIKVPTSTFTPSAPLDQVTFCIMVTTSDTTKIIAPLLA